MLGEIAQQIGELSLDADTPFGSYALLLGITLVISGFGFKIASVPFHMWAPDVYEGSPTPITAFLSVASKAAGFAAILRVFYVAFAMDAVSLDWGAVFAVLSVLSMTLGNLIAIRQDNIKRLLAYSSIAHAGYLLMGLVVLNNEGLRAVLFYLVVYYMMNLGAFMVVLMVLNQSGREDMEGFRGLAWRGGALPAAAMMIFLFSLAGLPPLAGFIGKFYLFAAVINEGMWVFALVAGLNSVVALYYYARIVRTMYMDQPVDGDPVMTVDLHNSVLVGALALGTLIFGVYWAPVVNLADRSVVFFGG